MPSGCEIEYVLADSLVKVWFRLLVFIVNIEAYDDDTKTAS